MLSPPRIDGVLTDEAWRAASLAGEFVQFRPAPGQPATSPTEVRVAYDQEALYVAIHARDAAPDSIVGRLARRDQAVHSDWVTVLVDSYHNRRTAFAFSVNPRGIKRDFTIVGDEQEDDRWDAVWEVATRQDATGWIAEFRIPLAQLRFNRTDRTVQWGINFSRLIARRDELSYWSPLLPNVAGVVSQFGELSGLSQLPSPRGLELLPYASARATGAPAPAAGGNPFYKSTAINSAAGADLRYGIGAGLTLSATINPDFGQVEADPSEVNLTANETRFAEKRPFFTEGTDIFGIVFPQVFYSRRIGAPPRGRVPSATFAELPERATIVGALKLSGQTASGWSIGVLDAVTAHERAQWVDTTGVDRRGTTPVEPLTNYLTARAVRDFAGGASALGFIGTSVTRGSQSLVSTARASQATVFGIDGRHKFGAGRYELSAAVLGSHLTGSRAAIDALQRNSTHAFHRVDATHLDLDSSATALTGYVARAWLSKIGGGGWRWQTGGFVMSPAFDVNDMGFVREADRARHWIDGSYRSLQPGKRFRRYNIQFGEAAAWTLGGERTDLNTHFRAQGQFHDHSSVQIFASSWAPAMNTNILRGAGGLMEQAGSMASLEYESDSRRGLRGIVSVNGWSEFGTDGGGVGISPELAWRPTSQAELSVQGSFERARRPAQYIGSHSDGRIGHQIVGAAELSTAAVTLRGDYTFTPTLSFQLYAQPFLSAGKFGVLRTVINGRTADFDREFRTLDRGEVTVDSVRRRRVDLDRDGLAEITVANPDFNVKHLNSTAVMRWEYRPGSSLFVVWGHGRSQRTADGRPRFGRDASDLLGTSGTNVLMVKLSYWMAL